MNPTPPDIQRCSELSLQAGEPLQASATRTRLYCLLEYNGAWGEKAFEESDVPEQVKIFLTGAIRAQADSKILLIRGQRKSQEAGIRFFTAVVSETGVRVHDFHVDRYEDLLNLDLLAVLENDPRYQNCLRGAPLYLVCTHGRRDVCCARSGLPVFNALMDQTRSLPDAAVWQCSHVGGHRFAANLICLPDGVLYGRVQPDDVSAILEAAGRRSLYLPNLRGRLCYPQPVQAAEIALYHHTGQTGLDAYHLVAIVDLASGEWQIEFLSQDNKRYRVHVRQQATGHVVYESCSLDKTTPVLSYTVGVEET